MPPATMTTWPVTWPESSSEARTTIWRATSSAWPTFRRAIVCVARATLARVGERVSRHRRLRPAGADGVHAGIRRHPDDLVLQAEEQPLDDSRLRRRVVGVAGLAEDPGRRADEHEAAVAGPLDLAEERRARSGRWRSGSRRASRASARGEAPRPERSSSGQTPATAAHTSTPPSASRSSAKSRSTCVLVGEVGLTTTSPPSSRGEGLGPLRGPGGSGGPRERPRPRTPAPSLAPIPPEAPVTSTRLPESPVSTRAIIRRWLMGSRESWREPGAARPAGERRTGRRSPVRRRPQGERHELREPSRARSQRLARHGDRSSRRSRRRRFAASDPAPAARVPLRSMIDRRPGQFGVRPQIESATTLRERDDGEAVGGERRLRPRVGDVPPSRGRGPTGTGRRTGRCTGCP